MRNLSFEKINFAKNFAKNSGLKEKVKVSEDHLVKKKIYLLMTRKKRRLGIHIVKYYVEVVVEEVVVEEKDT